MSRNRSVFLYCIQNKCSWKSPERIELIIGQSFKIDLERLLLQQDMIVKSYSHMIFHPLPKKTVLLLFKKNQTKFNSGFMKTKYTETIGKDSYPK